MYCKSFLYIILPVAQPIDLGCYRPAELRGQEFEAMWISSVNDQDAWGAVCIFWHQFQFASYITICLMWLLQWKEI